MSDPLYADEIRTFAARVRSASPPATETVPGAAQRALAARDAIQALADRFGRAAFGDEAVAVSFRCCKRDVEVRLSCPVCDNDE